MAGSSDQRRAALRDRIDQAMRGGRSSRSLVGMLERLAREAPRGSDDAVFAHRQLADLVFERAPWRALLHLRHVLGQRTDVVEAERDGVEVVRRLGGAGSGNRFSKSAFTATRKPITSSRVR